MPLPKTTRAEFARHLDQLGITAGDRLAVHSRLVSFGVMEGGAKGAAETLLSILGPEGTVIVPSYTFDPSIPYDPGSTPGEATGVLSEHIRQLPHAVRSRCPIHNHAGIGPDSGLLRESEPTISLGPDSDFDHMARRDFSVLLLGLGFSEGCTYVHHAEAMAGVPYRHWTDAARRVVGADGAITSLTCRYFARSRGDLVSDFSAVERELERRGQLRSAPCVLGLSFVARLADIHAATMDLLAADPFVLTRSA